MTVKEKFLKEVQSATPIDMNDYSEMALLWWQLVVWIEDYDACPFNPKPNPEQGPNFLFNFKKTESGIGWKLWSWKGWFLKH